MTHAGPTSSGLGGHGLSVAGGLLRRPRRSRGTSADATGRATVPPRRQRAVIVVHSQAFSGAPCPRRTYRCPGDSTSYRGTSVGFCLDTCHAHAGGEELAGIVDRVKAITGRVDLVHANDSRDTFDSGPDRHANLGSGSIDGDDIVAVVAAAGAPVVVETPGGTAGQRADIAFLRERLPA